MQKPTKFILLALVAPLFSCASSPTNDGVASEASKSQESSVNSVSEETSGFVSSEISDRVSSSSAGNDSASAKSLTAGWTLGSDGIKESKNNYIYDYSFSITNTAGQNVRFYGDAIQRGFGDYEGMVQMKKGVGFLECLDPHTGTVTLNVHKRPVSYQSSDGETVNRDCTGVPLFYTSSDCVTWTPLNETSKNDDANLTRVYTYKIKDAFFKFSPDENYALYLHSIVFGN